MKLDLKKFLLVLSIVIALSGVVYGSFNWLNTTYAGASEFKKHEVDNLYEFLNLKLEKIEDRIFKYEEMVSKKPNDIDRKHELSKLKDYKNKILKQIDEIEKLKLQQKVE